MQNRMNTMKVKNVVAAVVLALSLAAGAAPAKVALPDGSAAEFHRWKVGELLFSDRGFQVGATTPALDGAWFVCASIDGGLEIEIKQGGDIMVLTPVSGSCSQANELSRLGFVKDASVDVFIPFGSSVGNRVALWRRSFQKGERFKTLRWMVVAGVVPPATDPARASSPRCDALRERLAGKYPAKVVTDIMVTKPDFAVFVPQEPERRHERVKEWAHDTYNDHFQVIRDDARKVFHAFWTQATAEGHSDHHIAYSRSTDDGMTWSAPLMLAGSLNTNRAERAKHPTASWQQPMLAKSGRLYCLWVRDDDRKIGGRFSDDGGLTWSVSEVCDCDLWKNDDGGKAPHGWINWQRPLRLGPDGHFLVGSSRAQRVEFWEFVNIDDDPAVKDIVVKRHSTGPKMLAVPKDERGKSICEEASIMKLPDGRLFAVMRATGGSAVWSVSADCGVTWSPTEQLRTKDGGALIEHSVSPCPVYDWKGPEAGSGVYFGVFHLEVTDHRGPLRLVPGRFNPAAHQPVEFTGKPRLIVPRSHWNSLYTSCTMLGDECILWYNDCAKFYLLGKVITADWMDGQEK